LLEPYKKIHHGFGKEDTRMSNLVPPLGGGGLLPLLLEGEALAEEKEKACRLKVVPMTSREAGLEGGL
jgi:hypothetical protein